MTDFTSQILHVIITSEQHALPGCRLGRCSKATLDSVLAGQENGLLQPDNLIIAVLERELLLTEAKLHELHFDRFILETKFYHVARLIQLVRSITHPLPLPCGVCSFGRSIITPSTIDIPRSTIL